MTYISFIYSKDNIIKVLTHEESLSQHDQLTEEGWIHTSTLNLNQFIEYLYNRCSDEEIIDEINSLNKLKVQI